MTRTLSRRSRQVEPEENDDYLRDAADDEEPKRGRGRSRRRDDDEDEAPARRVSSRRARDEDDEDEAPARGRGRSTERPSANSVGRGWGAFAKKRTEHSDFVKNFALPEEATLIKVLEEEPFTVYAEHWLDERKGKKSFVCLGDDCPLCDLLGDKPRVYAMFNILDLTDPENPTVLPWKVSQTVTDVLLNYSKDAKTSPLNREDLYWSVFKSGGGKKGRVQTNLNPVKARDVADDWDIEPFTADELEEFTLLTEDDVLQFSTKKELKTVANEYDD